MPLIPIYTYGEACIAFDHDPETGKPIWCCQRCNISGADGPLKISGWVEVPPFPRSPDRRRLAEQEVGFRKISSEDLDVHFTIAGRGLFPLGCPSS